MKVLKILGVTFLAVLLTVAAAAGVIYARYERFLRTPFGQGEHDMEIQSGATLAEVASNLESAGVVADGESFFVFGRFFQHADRKLKQGEYGFMLPMTPKEVLDQIVAGRVKTYKVTVAEGLRMDEIAPLFEQAGVADAQRFLVAARDPKLLHKLHIAADNLEGYLYPDTYIEPKGRGEAAILEEMVAHFRRAYAAAQAQADSGVHLTELQAVTLASIIEKETGAPEERPHISCVFHNRMKLGMKLQTDPTVIYAQILKSGHFDGNITKAMLLDPHPYNTYTVVGLPPGPISNPGEAALAAALRPIECKDLFFVARGEGHHVFCPTLTCHNANVQRYQLGAK